MGCQQCKRRNDEWVWVGFKPIVVSEISWVRVHPKTGIQLTADALSAQSDFTFLEIPKHLSNLPDWVFNCMELEVLSMEYCEYIDSLPIAKVLNLPKLKELACVGCSKLYNRAQAICKQGGNATLRFLQEVNEQVNTRMNLFLIGEGEAVQQQQRTSYSR